MYRVGQMQAARPTAALFADSLEIQEELAPQVGLEPTTLRLTAGCSTIELLRNGRGTRNLLRMAYSREAPPGGQALPGSFPAPAGSGRQVGRPTCPAGPTRNVYSKTCRRASSRDRNLRS